MEPGQPLAIRKERLAKIAFPRPYPLGRVSVARDNRFAIPSDFRVASDELSLSSLPCGRRYPGISHCVHRNLTPFALPRTIFIVRTARAHKACFLSSRVLFGLPNGSAGPRCLGQTFACPLFLSEGDPRDYPPGALRSLTLGRVAPNDFHRPDREGALSVFPGLPSCRVV